MAANDILKLTFNLLLMWTQQEFNLIVLYFLLDSKFSPFISENFALKSDYDVQVGWFLHILFIVFTDLLPDSVWYRF